jgi:hypothetical protein
MLIDTTTCGRTLTFSRKHRACVAVALQVTEDPWMLRRELAFILRAGAPSLPTAAASSSSFQQQQYHQTLSSGPRSCLKVALRLKFIKEEIQEQQQQHSGGEGQVSERVREGESLRRKKRNEIDKQTFLP